MNKRMMVAIALALAGCTDDEALDAGDCPGTPTSVAIEPIAAVNGGLLAVTFRADNSPQGVDIQRYSPSRSVWEQTYGQFGQRDDGTYVLQVRPQTTATDATMGFKVRVRTTLQGCPPSSWGESDAVTLGDPVEGTTWIAQLARTDFTANISASASTGTSNGPYRLSQTLPLKHTLMFKANNVFSETFDFAIESGTAGDVYNNCHFVLAYDGVWSADYSYDTRVAIYNRTFVSSTGSTCTSPPLADFALAGTRLDDNVFNVSSVDYAGLLEVPAGKPRWQLYSYLQNAFSSILSSLSDQTGPDTASISGYINVFDPSYEKQ